MRITSAEEAVRVIKSNDRVFVHGAVATPAQLVIAMTARAAELRDVEIVHLHTEGPAPYASAAYADNFRTNCLFVGANVREAVNEGVADYIPVFLSEVPGFFRKGIMPLDVALVQVSPPDATASARWACRWMSPAPRCRPRARHRPDQPPTCRAPTATG
jgi:4-hydroxybutyrate CoA-transferase